MRQFDEFQDEDPYKHLKNFFKICDTYKENNVSRGAVCLRLFFS